jgi:hypothetical protein
MGTIRPLVFIGCGGSGGKTLRITHDAIMRRLRGKGWTQGMPESWQFLWIDVPMEQEGGDAFGHKLDPASYLGLVKPATVYRTGIDKAVMGIRNADLMDLVGWRPDPDAVKISIEDGAGQFRAIGRMISVRQGVGIAERIGAVYDSTALGTSVAQLEAVGQLLGAEVSQRPKVFLVSSLAGGSGAGTFLDVADIVAIHSGSTESVAGLLYTADVFKDVPGADGVEGNSLASLAELLAGYWSEDQRSLSLFASQGVSSSRVTRGGVSYPFLVGSTNANGVSLSNQVEVYRSIGELLALVTVSGEVQEAFMQFLSGNWQSAAINNSDRLGLQGPLEMAPTSSLGYARLGLGRDRFRGYSVRRLARNAIEFLSSGYLTRNRSSDEPMTPEEARKDIVEHNKLVFLDDCQLNEREAANQIIDALTPPETLTLWKKAIGDITQKQTGAPEVDLNSWVRRFQDTAALLQKDFDTSFENALSQSTRKWGAEAPERLLEAVRKYIAKFGLDVTIELLAYTKGELEDVAGLLIGEARKLDTEGSNWKGRIGQLGLPLTDRIKADHPKMNELIKNVTSPWYYKARSEVSHRASAVMIEFARDVVTPLAATLRAAQAEFLSDTAPKAGNAPEYTGWPTDQLIPDWVVPSKVEFLLDEVDTYPQAFLNLVAATLTKDEKADVGPQEFAMRNVISGGFRSASMTPTPRSVRRDLEGLSEGEERPWKPSVAGGDGSSPLKFTAHFRQGDLVARAEQWLVQPGAFRQHLDESLADYLAERDAAEATIADHQHRLATFEAKFTAALASAAPLIDVDMNLYAMTHPTELVPVPIIEPLPFPKGHPARKTAEDIIVKERQKRSTEGSASADALDDSFTSDSAGVSSVGIVSYFRNPVHPVVFKSVTSPIDARLHQGRAEFWHWRRTRRLSEFVPVSSSARRAMARGWYTARVLGMLETTDLQSPFRILSESGEWLEFPHPPLGGFVSRTALPFAAVLESLPLSWLSWAAGDPRETYAYQRLFQLGLSDPSSMTSMGGDGGGSKSDLFSYLDMNTELSAWVESGTVVAPAQPTAHGDNAEARVAGLKEVLSGMADVLTRSFVLGGTDSASLARAPRGIDLVPEVVAEIGRVASAQFVPSAAPIQ